MGYPSLLPALLAVLLVPLAPAARPLPPDLEGVRRDSVRRLAGLYGLPPEAAAIPIAVDFVTVRNPEKGAPWGSLPPFVAGAAEPASGRLVVFAARTGRYPFGDAAQTLRHELSHILLYRSLGFHAPRWLDEGLAMREAGEWGLPDEGYLALALFGVARGTFPLGRLEGDFRGGESSVRRSYALARGFVRDMFPRDGEVTAFVLDARRLRSADGAFQRRFGLAPEVAFRRWAKDLPWWGHWVLLVASPSLLWGFVGALFILAVWASIRRRRKVYEQLPD